MVRRMCLFQLASMSSLRRDMFTNEVIGVTSTSMHDFSSVVGKGSRPHALLGAYRISLCTSSSDAGEKDVSVGDRLEYSHCPGVGLCRG